MSTTTDITDPAGASSLLPAPAPQILRRNPGSVVAVAGLNHYFGEGEFRTQVLFDNRLHIDAGQLVVMTGPSGSGKTTLLTLLGAIRRMQEGSLTVLGKDMSKLNDYETITLRREIGFIFQMHNLFSSLTAIENVQMSCHGDAAAMAQATTDGVALLERLGLGHRVNYRPQALSGGQRQRVAVARALVGKPRLILADEPTAALDKVSCLEVIGMLKQWAAEHGSAVVVVTHDNRVLDAADRIVNMVDGMIVSDVYLREALMICEFLRQIDIFSHLSMSELTKIAEQMQLRPFHSGDVLIRQGDEGDEFFLLRDGTVDVRINTAQDDQVVDTLKAGQCFGERALLTGGPRGATVVAREEGAAYVLSKPQFLHAIEVSPDFKTQLQNLYFAK
jgi:putative ABC transport system ATP-binding protein